VCGERVVAWIDSVWDYVLYKPNPIVIIVYLLCAVGGFYVYVVYGFVHIPNPYIASYHKTTGTLLMLLCYYTYYRACTVEPGYLNGSTDGTKIKKCL
jgi:hypothetical protein